MPLREVSWFTHSDEDQELAKVWNIPVISAPNEGNYYLERVDDVLKLFSPKQNRWTPIAVDFNDPLFTKQSRKRGRNDILARAVAGTSRDPLRVFDSTMGYGLDGFFLACLGHNVVSCDRMNWLYALVDDARKRYSNGTQELGVISWQLLLGDSQDLAIQQKAKIHFNGPIDVLLCDPLFDAKRGSSPKEMQALHQLGPMTVNDGAWALAALENGVTKVVIKRPIHGEILGETKPSYQLKGRTIRYDVYRKA